MYILELILMQNLFFSFSSKLLHKRENEKVDAQEENFLPKYQRVKDLCQRAEYQTACEQLGQVGHCTPDWKQAVVVGLSLTF